MDIKALDLLEKRVSAHNKLLNPTAGGYDIDEFITNVKRTTQETFDCFKKVTSYAEAITEKLVQMREVIKKFNIHASEKMNQLLNEIRAKDTAPSPGAGKIGSRDTEQQRFLIVDHTETSVGRVGGKSTPSIGDSEIRQKSQAAKSKQLLELEMLAKQQLELSKLIASTESLVSKMEEEGAFSEDDIRMVGKNLEMWGKSLETEKEKQRRKQEEKERQEREKNRQAEEERRKREDEERKKREEEERKRKEAEERKRKQEEAKRLKEEEERRKREEEEKRRKEEEERKRKEEEEKKKKEEEERKQREEEERKQKEEEERKKREEEERRRKEEEKRRKEEERRREEERKHKEEEERKRKEEEEKRERERQRRNPVNWPTFIYERSKKGDEFHGGICCMVSAIQGEGGLTKDDLSCTCSDEADELCAALTSKEEQIISSIITVKYNGTLDVKLDEPMRVFVPASTCSDAREATIKISINDGPWEMVAPLTDPPNTPVQGVFLVGSTVNNFASLKIVSVSRLLRDHFIVPTTGKCIEPPRDNNIKLTVPPGSFPRDTDVDIKTVGNLSSLTKEAKDLNNIKIATSLHGIDFADALQKLAEVEMYPDTKTGEKSRHQRALQKCNSKLVTDIAVDRVVTDLHQRGVLDDSVLKEVKDKESDGARARRLMKEFEDCSYRRFEELIKSLDNANQGHLARLIKKTMEEEPSNESSDHLSDNKLQVVSSQDNGEWEVMNIKSIPDKPDAVYVSLGTGKKSFEILGLLVPKYMSNSDICRAAETVYNITVYTPVKLLCKQNIKEPQEIFLHCVPTDRVEKALTNMKSLGFTGELMESADFGICDGEDIWIRPESNIRFENERNEIRFRMFINMDSAKSNACIGPVNKKVQAADNKYHGQLCYNVSETQQPPPRSGSITVFLPKEEGYHRYAPLSLNVSLKAMAKFLAWQLSQTTESKQKLNNFYTAVAGSSTLLRKLQSRSAKESTSGTDREKCELFILSWASQRPKSEEKVITLIDCMRRVDTEIASEAEKFNKHYSTGILSNNYLEKIGNLVGDRWEDLARNLVFDDDEIEAMKIDFQDQQRRTIHMLDQFRLSPKAIEQGSSVGVFLHKSAELAKCSKDLTKAIYNNI